MNKYIVINAEGEVVAKYEKTNQPEIPDGYEIKKVDDLTDYRIESDVSWFPSHT